MHRHHEMIPSRALERHVHLWRYGHWGPPLLVFPTASGMAHEWEAQGVIGGIADLIDGGRVKLYCVESNVAEAWTRRENHPAWRIGRHLAFEAFVTHELVPWIRRDCRDEGVRLATAGASLGAMYAANFALKFPEVFRWALCLSGRYEATQFTGGFSDQDVYFNDPMAYVPHLHGEMLERIRRHTHLVLVCGQGAWEEGCIEETHAFADLLAGKGISHERDIWGHDVSHAWHWWRLQVRHHLGRVVG